jgi:hypothetical protein
MSGAVASTRPGALQTPHQHSLNKDIAETVQQ